MVQQRDVRGLVFFNHACLCALGLNHALESVVRDGYTGPGAGAVGSGMGPVQVQALLGVGERRARDGVPCHRAPLHAVVKVWVLLRVVHVGELRHET